MRRWLVILTLAVLSAIVVAPPARALTEFKTAFKKKYIDPHKIDAFKSLANKTSCDVCHVKGAENKKIRNAYGQALSKLIEGDAQDRKKDAKAQGGKEGEDQEKAKILAELEKAFEEVAKTKSPSGKTYGELIESGHLPVSVEDAVAAYKKEKEEKGEAGEDSTK